MKRRLIMLGVFLLLGAVVNVAVAWGLAMFSPMRYSISHSGVFEPSTIPNWDACVISRLGAVMVDAHASATMVRSGPADQQNIPHWSVTALAPSPFDAQRERSIQEIAYGFPLIASFSRDDRNPPGGMSLNIPWFLQYDRQALPIRPIFPGFAINTLFYAAVCWMLFAMLDVLRRQRRSRRGRCVHCGYDLRGHAPSESSGPSTACPECGGQLPLPFQGRGSG